MARAQRSDSIKAAVDASIAVTQPMFAPPAHMKLRDIDMPFWDTILRARARSEWSDDQLVIAAQLARCQADIEQMQENLDTEGHIIPKATKNGSYPVANPAHGVLEQLARRQIYLMRSMGMVGLVKNGDKRELVGKREAERKAREIHTEVGGEGGETEEIGADDLLAG